MIDLRVLVDREFVDLCRVGECGEMHDRVASFCRSNGLDASLKPSELLHSGEPLSESACASFRATADFLIASTDRSIAHIRSVLPSSMPSIQHDLVVKLLPLGKYNFGPCEGLQIFSLYPNAALNETYLFMVHVYYHDVSHLFYTDKCVRCSEVQNNLHDLIYWIKLLIRNEGIANYAVLYELRDFMKGNPDYDFCYFTYARQIDNYEIVAKGIKALNSIFSSLDDAEVASRSFAIVHALKSKFSPIINLVGIHMASAIADHVGSDALRDVYKKDADEFFQRYTEIGSVPLGVLARSG